LAIVDVMIAPSKDRFKHFILSNYRFIYMICFVDIDEPLSIFFNSLVNDYFLLSFSLAVFFTVTFVDIYAPFFLKSILF